MYLMHVKPINDPKQCWRRPLHHLSDILPSLDLAYVYVLAIMTYYQGEGVPPIGVYRIIMGVKDASSYQRNYLKQFSSVSTSEILPPTSEACVSGH